MTRSFMAMVLALVLTACATAPSGGGGLGGPVVPATSGGAPGSTCPTDGGIACAPGAMQKVRCTGGAWTDDGACASGTTCQETKDGSGKVVATACVTPPSTNVGFAAACAKALGCTGETGSSMDRCVNRAAHGAQIKALYTKLGVVLDLDDAVVYDDLASHTGCLATAKSCDDVGKCLGGGQSCAVLKSGCAGNLAWKCAGGQPLALDCATLGLQCGLIAGNAGCGHPVACSGPEGITCSGDTATICLKDKAKGFAGAQITCGGLGLGCSPQADLGCTAKGEPDCAPATFVDHCEGNVRKRCKSSGTVASDDCGLTGETCFATKDAAGNQHTSCDYGQGCDDAPACDGTRLEYCEAGKRVSYDCAAGGMKCDPTSVATCRF